MTNDNLMGYRLSADIGGTFTDLVIAAPDGGYWTKKLSSTQDDLSRGIIEGMRHLLHEQQLPVESIEEIVHGTTVATNAILQGQGREDGPDNDRRLPRCPRAASDARSLPLQPALCSAETPG